MSVFSALYSIPNLIVRLNEQLSKYTAARLGGPADALVVARSSEAIVEAIQVAQKQAIPWLILGGGTNVLISDKGVRGIVIINQAKAVDINAEEGTVRAEGGANLSTLARRCMSKGLKGLEWAVSVPGTVGGAVVNNAGAHGGDMSDNLVETHLFDVNNTGEPQVWPLGKLDYDYRHSSLKGQHGRYVVLQAILQLESGHDPQELSRIADEFVAHRKRTQPPGASLGSIFKNPPNDYAGRLIEACGLKGYCIGGVAVSPVHANFFVNDGSGTASDYSALIDHIQAEVMAQTGVQLDIEIERIGEEFL
jgi:UDP-N-acetylmuramate dehydrogenase